MNYYRIWFGYLGCFVVCNSLLKLLLRFYRSVRGQKLTDYKIESIKLPIQQEKDENYVLFNFEVLNGAYNLCRSFIDKGYKVLIVTNCEKQRESEYDRDNIRIITYNSEFDHETFAADLSLKLNYFSSGHRHIRVYVNSPFSEMDITSQVILLKLVISKMLLKRGKSLILGISGSKEEIINNKMMRSLHNLLFNDYSSKIDITFISHSLYSIPQLRDLNLDQINLSEKNNPHLNKITDYIKYYSQKVIKS